jgi:hypothetical protein
MVLKKVSYSVRNLKMVSHIVRNLKRVLIFATNSEPFKCFLHVDKRFERALGFYETFLRV